MLARPDHSAGLKRGGIKAEQELKCRLRLNGHGLRELVGETYEGRTAESASVRCDIETDISDVLLKGALPEKKKDLARDWVSTPSHRCCCCCCCCLALDTSWAEKEENTAHQDTHIVFNDNQLLAAS